MGIMSEGSPISNLTFAVYTGETVEALTLVDKRQGSLFLESIQGGTTYAIAAVVEADARGGVAINLVSGNGPFGAPPSYEVPGNILCESSFEGTDMDLRCWHAAGIGYNGAIGQSDGADGTTWVIVNTGGGLWQEVPTQPGLSYPIKFAFRPEFGVTSGKAVAKWDNLELGFALSPPEDEVYWHWAEFTATATSELSRFSVEVVEGVLGLDAFSIVPLSAPPVILTQPNSASTFAGGSVSLLVGSSGSPPLSYQWFHAGTALENETNKVLTLSPVTASDAGSYYVLVSNPHGTATSEAAVLVVEQLGTPTIVLQPYGDRIPEGASYTLSVAAVGTPPLFYQWLYHGNDLPGATERHYLLEAVQQTNAGVYSVRVWNSAAETVWSLPATLWVDTNAVGGGALHFINELPEWDITRQMWIYDTDGFTKLRGTNFAAQLYAGPTLDSIRALGPPRPFLTGFYAGLFDPVKLVLPTVPWPGEAFVQVRVWETSFGSRYEEARALGGKFGSSEFLRIQVGLLPEPPPLWGLKSFSLQAGRPEFTVGRVDLAERHADGSLTWSVTGEAGYLYLIEKQLGDAVWRPLLVITNETGVSQFRDPSAASENLNLYRARILD